MQIAVHQLRSRRLRALALPCTAVVAAMALSGPASAASAAPAPSLSPSSAAPGATSQGIIMRDGGVCDPIRHMGC